MIKKKNLFIIYLFLLTSYLNTSRADYPYFHFDKLNIKLSFPRYSRYVRPQLKNIVSDFFHIMKKIEPAEQDLILIRNKTQSINDLWDNWVKHCSVNDQDKCYKLIKKVYIESRALDTLILVFQNKRLRIKHFENSDLLDDVLHLTGSLEEISIMNYQILHLIEESLIISSSSYNTSRLTIEGPKKLLNNMLTSSELIMTALISKNFQNEFDKIWFGFIKKIQRQILFNQSPDYLLKYLGDLNMSWNSFHMKVSKSKLKLKNQELKVIQIMHNRWNSILKVLLRN